MREIKTPPKQVRFMLLAGMILAGSFASAQTSPFQTNINDFLPPDEAFRMNVVRDGVGYAARWEIADQYYLYREKIRIETPDVSITSQVPPGMPMRDEFFGETDVFRHFVKVPFALNTPNAGKPMIAVTYQGCADAGLCYPPITRQVDLSNVSLSSPGAPSGSPQVPVSEQFLILDRLKNSNLMVVILAFFSFGLLLALTPCVLPMVPILSSIIARNSGNKKLSTTGAFSLSLGYVLAMSITYSLFGVAIGLTGESLQIWLQHPWVIAAVATVFALLALSMFGLYNLQMPAPIQARLQTIGNRSDGKHSALGNAALMGVASALIVGPCVTPPLIGALLFIAQTGNAMIGGLALFFLALGMGTPLLIIGTSLGRLLPRPGEMLNTIKPIFGLLMLGVAIWLLDRITSPVVILWLSGALLTLTSTCLYQMVKSVAFNSGGKILVRGMATVALLYGALLIAVPHRRFKSPAPAGASSHANDRRNARAETDACLQTG